MFLSLLTVLPSLRTLEAAQAMAQDNTIFCTKKEKSTKFQGDLKLPVLSSKLTYNGLRRQWRKTTPSFARAVTTTTASMLLRSTPRAYGGVTYCVPIATYCVPITTWSAAVTLSNTILRRCFYHNLLCFYQASISWRLAVFLSQ